MKSISGGKGDNENLLFQMQLPIPCHVDAIDKAVHLVMAAVSETHCVCGSHFEVDLALREALANAVTHGCGNDVRQEVQLTVTCDESQGILIVIRDPGSGFDLSSIPSPVQGQNIYSSHGRGIFLINQLMDEVQFGCDGSELRMRKR